MRSRPALPFLKNWSEAQPSLSRKGSGGCTLCPSAYYGWFEVNFDFNSFLFQCSHLPTSRKFFISITPENVRKPLSGDFRGHRNRTLASNRFISTLTSILQQFLKNITMHWNNVEHWFEMSSCVIKVIGLNLWKVVSEWLTF